MEDTQTIQNTEKTQQNPATEQQNKQEGHEGENTQEVTSESNNQHPESAEKPATETHSNQTNGEHADAKGHLTSEELAATETSATTDNGETTPVAAHGTDHAKQDEHVGDHVANGREEKTGNAVEDKRVEDKAPEKNQDYSKEEQEAIEKHLSTNRHRPEAVYQPATAHDDFDWSVDKRNVSHYAKDQRELLDNVYGRTFKEVGDSELLNGTVVGITKTDVIINIGFKSDGMVSLNEFRDTTDGVKIGDEIEVIVVEKEDKNGHLHLSRKLARAARAWQRIVDFYKTGEIVTGTITSKTKGGLIVDVYGLETFLPGSQIDVKPVTDYDQYVGKTMDFKVVKVNEIIRNAVVSHKALIESDIEQQRSVIISQLEKGQVLEGTVKNVTDFGAFIDLGGVDGLLYITDISWGRVNHPSEVLENGQKLNVVVLEFDDEKKRISLGLKQLTPHPWDTLTADIVEGSEVTGKVVNIEDYGAFLEILPGVEGLVHVSEITWSSQPINAKEFFKQGEEYKAKVVTLDKDERKMSLSIKQLTSDPWDTIEERFPIDSRHNGTVKNLTPYGVFVELESGIGGMIHISDLSWIKRFNHPSEFTKTGEPIEVMILGIDKDNRKLSLGHKQVEEDPWATFETIFPVGSIHEGTVTKKDDKGANIQLQYGLEAYAPARHLRKEDGSMVNADETLDFMIIEFDKNDKRIMVSHTKVWEQTKAEEKEAERRTAIAETAKTQKAVKNVQQKIEKPTLGDLGALGALKEKLKKQEDEDEKNKS